MAEPAHLPPLLCALRPLLRPGEGIADHATLARERGMDPGRLRDFISFFPAFQPAVHGTGTVRVCTGPACLAAGARERLDAPGAIAGPCVGRCEQAPVTEPPDIPRCPATVQVPDLGWLDGLIGDAAEAHLLDAIRASGLSGMGGAGFPTHKKLAAVRAAKAPLKYAIANADEGEPGTFKDRYLIDHHPEQVLAGLLLACRITGAAEAFVYIRHEYAAERANLEGMLKGLADTGRVSTRSPSPLSPKVSVIPAGGAYICGEETALIASIEGRRPTPSPGPPHPVETGLWGAPTLVQNIETLYYIAQVARSGADGQEVGYAGKRHFSVSGQVAEPGVYELPTDATARQLLAAAGGMTGGREPAAFIPGGGSTGLLPPAALDVPLTVESLKSLDTAPGTGGLVFLGGDTCPLQVAAHLARFYADESCGQCDPCRLGAPRLANAAADLCRGEAVPRETVTATAHAMTTLSICGLGQWAPLVVTSLYRHFPDLMDEHRNGVCRAGQCDIEAL
ncbi:MAG: NADH-ubiquinone oxidoreductase-F iron-sulfur binding region domain-containing protein [Leptospirillia bacterium]